MCLTYYCLKYDINQIYYEYFLLFTIFRTMIEILFIGFYNGINLKMSTIVSLLYWNNCFYTVDTLQKVKYSYIINYCIFTFCMSLSPAQICLLYFSSRPTEFWKKLVLTTKNILHIFIANVVNTIFFNISFPK